MLKCLEWIITAYCRPLIGYRIVTKTNTIGFLTKTPRLER